MSFHIHEDCGYCMNGDPHTRSECRRGRARPQTRPHRQGHTNNIDNNRGTDPCPEF